MNVFPISSPFPGEHLIGTFPVMRPETANGWRLRLNFWPGRALTAEALELEQENRAGRFAGRGRLATPGIVAGLEVALESPPTADPELKLAGHFIHVMPGHGFLAGGEDVVVPRPLRVPLDKIRADAEFTPNSSWAAVLVLRPAEFRVFDKHDPEDPCQLDPSQDPFASERRQDACILRLCQLPAELKSLPVLGNPDDPHWRNRLAHVIFSEEAAASARQQIRFRETLEDGTRRPDDQRWDTLLLYAGLFPWELVGMPLALLSFELIPGTQMRRFFLDRASVARPGGQSLARPRPAVRLATGETEETFHPRGAGTPFNWKARVDQFAEQLGPIRIYHGADVAAAASQFQFLPPTGFLPRIALKFLTTSQAMALPLSPNQAPDRAGMSHFFPTSFEVEAVPVAIEDLDAALAAGAVLAPYDLRTTVTDNVRVLVPLPERVFDPQLLVIEREDPIFAATVGRFVATRQDWRQRRDFVRGRRDAFDLLATGPHPPVPLRLLDPGQLEREPVETVEGLGFTEALLSPVTTPPPWEIRVDFAAEHAISSTTTLFLALMVDADFPPGPIEVRWRKNEEEFGFRWIEPPAPPLERIDTNGESLATPLWQRFTVAATQLGLTPGKLTGFTLRLYSGRIGLAAAGELGPDEQNGEPVEHTWWRAQERTPEPRFTGGEWTRIPTTTDSPKQLLAPFEDLYIPVFPDGRTQDQRIKEVETAINPLIVTKRAKPLSVDTDGLERVLAELDAEAGEADDFVDANFTRAQVNLYRIRKLVLGENAAQKLLINPAIATIAEQETATASADQLTSFIKEAKKTSAPVVTAEEVNTILAPKQTSLAETTGTERFSRRTFDIPTFDPTILDAAVKSAVLRERPLSLPIDAFKALDLVRDIKGQLPESGPTLPPRGLSIGLRFEEPKATKNLAHSRAALNELLNQLPRLRLSLTGETVRTLKGDDISLLELQGRINRQMSPGDLTVTPNDTGGSLKSGEYFYQVTAIYKIEGETLPSPEGTANVAADGGSVTIKWKDTHRSAGSKEAESIAGYRVYRRAKSSEYYSASATELSYTDTGAPGTTGIPPTSRETAINRLLTVDAITVNVDEADVTLAALDITETKSAILRTIERIIQQRRLVVKNGLETLSLLRARRDAAAARVLVIEGRLAEARHDVSVARTLRQEEQQRVASVNERRDALLVDEVTFLAYTRPRAVDLIHRSLAYWKLELEGTPAPIPACLRRHDEAPPPLNAYIQLFREAPVRWFPSLDPLLVALDTSDKMIALMASVRSAAVSFGGFDAGAAVRDSAEAVQITLLGAHQVVSAERRKSASIEVGDKTGRRWKDFHRDAQEHAAIGDLIRGAHGSQQVSVNAAKELEQIGHVATCLHAEFAAVPPAIRLVWVERFSQFDRPGFLRDLSILPHYGRLDRPTRRTLQEFADWLFGRVKSTEQDALNLMNDLVRLCLLLASHAPVNRIIAGHLPRPIPVRVGIRIPIRPLNPDFVRVGMEFHVWQASRVVARGRVEDLQQDEVTARVDQLEAQTTTLDTTMRVQFVAVGIGIGKQLGF